jgi:hypothetical protein
MIQRIQSVYLAIAALACILCFFFPFANYLSETAYYKLMLTGLVHVSPDPVALFPSWFSLPLLGIHLALMFYIVMILFAFKNRIKQLKMIRFTLLINILYIGLLFFYTNILLERNLGVTTDYDFGSYFPVIVLVMVLLAKRGIEKDEKLVRSMDRLR